MGFEAGQRIVRTGLAAIAVAFGVPGSAVGAEPNPADWPAVISAAKGQTVYFHAWGGEPKINSYIEWAGRTVEQRHGVKVVHVKVTDTADSVGRVVAEVAAGKTAGGSIDLIWINGKNFAALKQRNLLFGPFAEALPSFAKVDVIGNPSARMDFTIPTEGYEAPWGLARLTFFHDAARDPVPPRSPDDLESFARQNPGRFTYPQPPDFLGSTFLKQLLISFAPDRGRLQREADDQSFAEQTGAVWSYLERLHPHLWRQGRTFPANVASLRRLFADNEIRVAFTFNPADVTAAIARGELAPSTQAYGFVGGTLGNTHFVAIPRNASAKAGALVLANFLLSPEAQARKADPNVWGDPTVLSPDLLTAQEQALFAPETLKPVFSEAVLAEPHPSWTERLDAEWKRRFGGGR